MSSLFLSRAFLIDVSVAQDYLDLAVSRQGPRLGHHTDGLCVLRARMFA